MTGMAVSGTGATPPAGIVFTDCELQAAADHGHGQGHGGDHAHARRREVVVAGKRVKTVDVHAHCVVPQALALVNQPLDAKGLQGALVLGIDALPAPGATRLIVASSHAVPDRDDIEVVLPLAHPYETVGSWTNLEGLRQPLAAGGFAGRAMLMDHALLQQLAAAAAPTANAAAGRA